MSEVKDIDDAKVKIPCQATNEEFFDAEEEVDTVKDDDADDFLKKLEAAIEGSPPTKRRCLDTPTPPLKIAESGETELVEENRSSNHSELLKSSPTDPTTEIDDDKLENDLLKDLDDDHIEDFESVCEEVKNLVESVLEDDVNSKKSSDVPDIESIEEENKDQDKKDGDENNAVDKETVVVKENGAVDSTTKLQSQDEARETKVDDRIEEETTSSEIPTNGASDDKEIEVKNDDLLVACASPKELPPNDRENSSETSSSAGDTPEDSDCEKQAIGNGSSTDRKGLESKETTDTEAQDDDKDEQMEIERHTIGELIAPLADNESAQAADHVEVEEHLCIVLEEDPGSIEPDKAEESSSSSSTKEFVPLKLPFLRKYSSTVGRLSRMDLEQLLIEKITESIMFCTENTDIRCRLERQEKISEVYKKRLDNIKKQYNDLEMIHNRVMKDLKDRPEAPITPVKITRAVGLQVYQPQARTKFTVPSTPQSNTKVSKRPVESEPVVNGNSLSPETKRKKTLKTTPLRPPLTDIQRKSLELEEAKVEQNLRKNVIGSISSAVIPASITMTPVNVTNGGPDSKKTFSSQSIDLTDDGDETGTVSKASPQVQQPPALVAIRNQGHSQRYIIQPSQPNNRVFQQRTNSDNRNMSLLRVHPAPLPQTPVQISKPGTKKIPPRPNIKINNVQNGIIVSWSVDGMTLEHADIHSYQIYAYEVTGNEPASENWRHVGDVKALLLPMAVTLTQFQEGQKYFFAVRAVDMQKRLGQFSIPKTWMEK